MRRIRIPRPPPTMKRFINRPAVAAALAAAALVAAPAVWLARAEPGQTQAQAQGQTQTPPGPQGAGANRGDGNRANGNRTDGTRPDINRTRPSSASAPAGPRGMQRPFDPGPVTAADWADISDFMSQ